MEKRAVLKEPTSGDIKVNLKTERQWQLFIQAVIGWSRGRPCNSKGAARKLTFAAGALTADWIDFWIRRHLIEYCHGTHPSQNPARDRRVGLSAIGQCRTDHYGALTIPIAPHFTAKQEKSLRGLSSDFWHHRHFK
jgi:hypothetical protein